MTFAERDAIHTAAKRRLVRVIPMRCLLSVVLCVLGGLAWSGSALATAPISNSPAPGASYEIGRSLDFSVSYGAAAGPAISRLKVRYSSSPATGPDGVLAAGTTLSYPLSSAASTFTFTALSYERPTAPGTYYWQPYADAYGTDYPLEVGAVQPFQAVVPQGPTSFSPANGMRYQMASGRGITFTVSGQSTVFDRGDLLISRSPNVDASGRLGSDVTSGILGTSAGGSASYTSASYVDIASKAGVYYWQAALSMYGGDPTVYSAVQSFTIVAPQGLGEDGVLRRDGIPAWAGTRGSWSYRINSSYGVPSYVSAGWFHSLARLSAWRWGLSYGGTTSAVPGLRDGTSSVGFSYMVPAGILGVQSTGFVRRTKWVRSCKRVRGTRRCKTVRRVVRVVVEKDLLISRSVFWEEGPAYPLSSDYDLESVLIHEFGHMASNRNVHVYGCVNSPMLVAAGPGEWWRSPTDWARTGCAQRDAAYGGHSTNGRRLHFKYVSYEVTDSWRAGS